MELSLDPYKAELAFTGVELSAYGFDGSGPFDLAEVNTCSGSSRHHEA